MKKKLDKCIINSVINEIKTYEEKASKVEKCDDVAAVFWEFEYIIESNEKNIIWLKYLQGKIFQ